MPISSFSAFYPLEFYNIASCKQAAGTGLIPRMFSRIGRVSMHSDHIRDCGDVKNDIEWRSNRCPPE